MSSLMTCLIKDIVRFIDIFDVAINVRRYDKDDDDDDEWLIIQI